MAARGKNEPPAPIIVKKVTIVEGGHHGGAWKVAYADFVTAMMAFFLLLWILGATTEKQRKGIADYFSPTLVKTKSRGAGSAGGLLGGSSLVDKDQFPNPGGQGREAITVPRGSVGGPDKGDTSARRQAAKQRIQDRLEASARLRKLARQVRMVDTTQGIRIDLVDDADFSMFRLGTTLLTPEASELLGAIGEAVSPGGQKLTIRGHTDALPWRDGRPGNNWSLSAGRAEATRQQLLRDGIDAERIRRIEGVADTELLIPADPNDPRNRRISITVLD